MIEKNIETLSNVLELNKDNKDAIDKSLLLSNILSPEEYIHQIKEFIYDAEYSFMNGDCGALAISLDILYGDDESSFVVIHKSRGDGNEEDEDEEPSEEDEIDTDSDYLWRLSSFGEMRHILWKDKEGKYFDILGKHSSIAQSIERSEEFYDEYGMPSIDVDAKEFNSKTITKEEFYEKIIRGTRTTFNSPLEIIDTVADEIENSLKLKSKLKI